MRRGGRTRPQAPLIQSYARRRGLVGTIQQQRGRTRLLEVAPRVGGVVNITRVTAGGAPAASGGGGHIIEDEGVPLAQRGTMNFVGAGVTAADAGGKTVVTIPGGGAGGVDPIALWWIDGICGV